MEDPRIVLRADFSMLLDVPGPMPDTVRVAGSAVPVVDGCPPHTVFVTAEDVDGRMRLDQIKSRSDRFAVYMDDAGHRVIIDLEA